MKEIDKRYMDLLFEEAKDLPPVGSKRARVMAALVFKKTLVLMGHNAERTDPLQRFHSCCQDKEFIHAEMAAIKRAINHFRGDRTKLKDATLYVVRAKKIRGNKSKPSHSWTWGNSKPCSVCTDAIRTYGIKKVVYSLDEIHECGDEIG